jgi:hypothetical protein
MRILDYLKKGTLVELVGTPFAKGYLQEDSVVRTEIRLNVSKTNILRPCKSSPTDDFYNNLDEEAYDDTILSDDDDDFGFDDL